MPYSKLAQAVRESSPSLAAIVDELRGLEVAASASPVRPILIRHELRPAPERDGAGRRRLLRPETATMLA
jgi:hypothetical protein